MRSIFVVLASFVMVMSFKNPYCPSSITLISEYGIESGASNQYCINSLQRAYDSNGLLECKPFACCQCYEIQCGDYDDPNCDELLISDSGAIGNQNIKVYGNIISAFDVDRDNIINDMTNGAQIICNGITSCMLSNIYGEYVGKLSCLGYMACYGANIRLINPGLNLNIECIGMMSCMNTKLEIIIMPQLMSDDEQLLFELDTIKFNGQESSKGMVISIINYGNLPVSIQNIQCINPISCNTDLNMQIKGFVNIQNCLNTPFVPSRRLLSFGFFACNPSLINPVLSQPIQSQPVLPGIDHTEHEKPDTGDLIDCAQRACKGKQMRYTPNTLGKFQLICPGDACTNYRLTLTGSKISSIDKLKFTEKNMNPKSTDKTVIKFESIAGQSVTIGTLNCAKRNACRNLEIISNAPGGAQVTTVKCPKGCPECTIDGKPCKK